jgi:hypothetical protein
LTKGDAFAIARESDQEFNVVPIVADDMRPGDLEHMAQTDQLLTGSVLRFPGRVRNALFALPVARPDLRKQ